MNDRLIKVVRESFKDEFKTEPLMVFSPGRINLIGEHTDYNLGFVFPAAINKGIVCAIEKSNTSNCTVSALDMDETFEFDLNNLKALQNGQWQNYIIGVVAEIQKKGLKLKPFNMTFSGDIPKGAGLSSSAALENSVVYGLNELFKLGLSKFEMIHISQNAEHNYVGVKCGIMDQYASMFGQEDSALMIDCKSLDAKTITIEFQNYEIVLINTNVSHNLVDAEYNDRRHVCEKVASMLKVDALRFATEADLLTIKSKISEDEYQKALYILQENERVQNAYQCLIDNDIEGFGALLFKAHDGASQQFKISCDELDFLVDYSKKHPDVIGARMMGGGFGGCTINIVKTSEAKNFIAKIEEDYRLQFNKNCSVYKVKLSKGTHKINTNEF